MPLSTLTFMVSPLVLLALASQTASWPLASGPGDSSTAPLRPSVPVDARLAGLVVVGFPVVMVGVLHGTLQEQVKRRRVMAANLAHKQQIRSAMVKLAESDRRAGVHKKKQRRPKERLPHTCCDWWRLYHDEASANAETRAGQKFRRRFRVPPSMVRELIDLVRGSGRWSEAPDAAGAPGIPIELLVMGSLQVLGRAVPLDLAAEGAHCSEVRHVWVL